MSVKRDFSRILDLGTPGSTLAAHLTSRGAVTRTAPDAELLGEGGFNGVVADEERLPFEPESFDLAVSALALHNVNDLPGTLIQVRRALRPDGLFLAALMGGQSLTELRQAFLRAEEETMGGVSPRVAPFVDLRDLGALMQRAGFALPVTDSDVVRVRYASMFDLIRDLRAMGATNVLTSRSRKPLRRATLLRAAEIYTDMFSDPDGRVRATFEIVYLAGWVPHESQQKPLKPGSATVRLADALKTKTYEE